MYVPSKSPFGSSPELRAYLEREFHAIARSSFAPYADRSPAEIAAGVQVVNPHYWEGHLYRYGSNASPGVTDMTDAFQAMLSFPGSKYVPSGVYRVTEQCDYGDDDIHVYARGAVIQHETATAEAVIYARSRSRCSWTGGTIDGRKSLKSGTGVVQAYGFEIYGCHDFELASVYVHDTFEHGIKVGQESADPDDSSEIRVLHVMTRDCGNAANNRGWGIWCFGSITNLKVVEPICIDNRAGGIFFDDVSGDATPGFENYNITLTNPMVISANSTPISTSACVGFGGSQRWAVVGGVCNGYSHALVLDDSQANAVCGFGTVLGGTWKGLQHAIGLYNVRDVIVAGAELETSNATTVQSLVEMDSRRSGATNLLKNIKIIGCNGRTAGPGIRCGLDASHSGVNDNITIERNTLAFVDGTAGSDELGIVVDATARAFIDGNNVRGFYDGIVTQSNFPASAELYVTSNKARESVRYGLNLDGETDTELTLIGNATKGNGTLGAIVAAALATGLESEANVFRDGSSGI